MITEQRLKLVSNHPKLSEWLVALNNELPKFQINTKAREDMFLAQVTHESGGFTVLEENLNYSKERLMQVFPKYFNEKEAERCARKPQLIANRVYANRMGNGDEASGDGFKYKGRGIIQLTGKSNYEKFSNDIYKNDFAIKNPELVATLPYAITSACWFWSIKKLNILSDACDILSVTKIINGGTHGIIDRTDRYNKLRSAA